MRFYHFIKLYSYVHSRYKMENFEPYRSPKEGKFVWDSGLLVTALGRPKASVVALRLL